MDDVLVTGGTAEAMLVRRSGAAVAGCDMLMELDALNGRHALDGIPLSVLLHVQAGMRGPILGTCVALPGPLLFCKGLIF